MLTLLQKLINVIEENGPLPIQGGIEFGLCYQPSTMHIASEDIAQSTDLFNVKEYDGQGVVLITLLIKYFNSITLLPRFYLWKSKLLFCVSLNMQ